MKKAFIFLLMAATFSLIILTACGNRKEIDKNIQPELPQIKAICNLSTLECYYHTVGTTVKNKSDDQQITDILKKDRTLWIEYTGVARIGIDMDKVKMDINGETIQITIPDAKLITSWVDEESFVFYRSEDDWLVKNKIDVDIQKQALQKGQEEMEADVLSNSALLNNAQIRAQKLIKKYIDEISKVSGIKYSIIWKYEDGTTSSVIPAEVETETKANE